jgi:hypothetical protein
MLLAGVVTRLLLAGVITRDSIWVGGSATTVGAKVVPRCDGHHEMTDSGVVGAAPSYRNPVRRGPVSHNQIAPRLIVHNHRITQLAGSCDEAHTANVGEGCNNHPIGVIDRGQS